MTAPGLLPLPLPEQGFPHCPRCSYRINGTSRICGSCASRTLTPLAEHHCPVCCQSFISAGERCRNSICNWSMAERAFTRVDTVAMLSPALNQKIKEFKYGRGVRGWGIIFGRLIIGWMDAHAEDLTDIDLVLGNPTAPDRQPYQHIEAVLEAAYNEDTAGNWPIPDPREPVLIKTQSTPRSAGSGWLDKMRAADQHADALELRRPDLVAGKRILLIDDLFTTGAQMHTVSRFLVRRGRAASVRGLVLGRANWR